MATGARGEVGSRCYEKGSNIFPTKVGSEDEAPTKLLKILNTYAPAGKLSYGKHVKINRQGSSLNVVGAQQRRILIAKNIREMFVLF